MALSKATESSGNMKYLQRKRKERLYKQWVNQAGLPPGEIPPDLLDEQATGETDLATEGIPRDRLPQYQALIDIDRGMVRLPFRYVLIGLGIIALLLVILSVVITVLITRS
jgi:hypothetical protein